MDGEPGGEHMANLVLWHAHVCKPLANGLAIVKYASTCGCIMGMVGAVMWLFVDFALIGTQLYACVLTTERPKRMFEIVCGVKN